MEDYTEILLRLIKIYCSSYAIFHIGERVISKRKSFKKNQLEKEKEGGARSL